MHIESTVRSVSSRMQTKPNCQRAAIDVHQGIRNSLCGIQVNCGGEVRISTMGTPTRREESTVIFPFVISRHARVSSRAG